MAHIITVPAGFGDFAPDATVRQPAAPSIFARLRGLFGRAPTSEVESFIQANGGVLTDDLERQIGRRFGRRAGL